MNLNLLRYVASTFWAMPKDRLLTLWALITRGAIGAPQGGTAEAAEAIEARRGDDFEMIPVPDAKMQMTGTIAVIPVYGEITPRANIFTMLFGGATLDRFKGQFRRALSDEGVKAIILRFDSPGGAVDGVTEMAAEIYAARGQKPIVAIADTLMASAALWLGSQADQVVAMPSAMIGSVGVVAMHEDVSKMLADLGVNITLLASDENKTAGNPFEPLSEAARADIQAKIDDMAGTFRADVARGRGITAKQVKDTYGEGRLLTPKEARAVGMIDRIETFDALVARLASRRVAVGQRAATFVPTADAMKSLGIADIFEMDDEDAAGVTVRVAFEDGTSKDMAAADYLPWLMSVLPAQTTVSVVTDNVVSEPDEDHIETQPFEVTLDLAASAALATAVGAAGVIGGPDPRADYFRTAVALAEARGREHGV